jgi:hypothetical protein
MLKIQPSQKFKKMASLERAHCHISNDENDTSNNVHMQKLWEVKVQVNLEEICGKL